MSYTNYSYVICDGVGAWRKYGVDPHLFANELCTQTDQFLQEHLGCDSEVDAIIEEALKSALDKAHSKHMGTSTISVGVLVSEREKFISKPQETEGKNNIVLYTGNIGDSGYMIFRNNQLYYKSKAEQDSFNLPHQLGTNGHDIDETLVLNKHTVLQGDTVIFATDGLFDNSQDNDILNVVNSNGNFEEMAMDICVSAKDHAMNSDRLSPFAKSQAEERGVKMHGGKNDDISVIAIRIV